VGQRAMMAISAGHLNSTSTHPVQR
jgi:hypothetical protein